MSLTLVVTIMKYSNMDDKTVVWFDNVDHWPTNFEGSNYDFQMVFIHLGDIGFNYRSMLGDASFHNCYKIAMVRLVLSLLIP